MRLLPAWLRVQILPGVSVFQFRSIAAMRRAHNPEDARSNRAGTTKFALLAQLAERLPCKQEDVRSIRDRGHQLTACRKACFNPPRLERGDRWLESSHADHLIRSQGGALAAAPP
jgi:hypothetical protein